MNSLNSINLVLCMKERNGKKEKDKIFFLTV